MTSIRKSKDFGFSLIELIAAIAIMSVMIAIVSPTFVRFIEKSRAASDMANANELINTLQVITTDDAVANNSFNYVYVYVQPKNEDGSINEAIVNSDGGSTLNNLIRDKLKEHGINLHNMSIRSKTSDVKNGYVVLYNHNKELIYGLAINNTSELDEINLESILSERGFKRIDM